MPDVDALSVAAALVLGAIGAAGVLLWLSALRLTSGAPGDADDAAGESLKGAQDGASVDSLLDQLSEAEQKVEEIRAKLGAVAPAPSSPVRKPVRVWMDGAFDMMHYGHVNAFRQGRALGTHLVVGVNDDESITQCKGPPVMNDAERLAMVRACKFVDEVVPKVPYVMNADYVQWMLKAYDIDYIVHGDDPCIVDGRDVYESAKALGKYLTIPRTEGVSTTEIVGRMLLLTNTHHQSPTLPPSDQGTKLRAAIPELAPEVMGKTTIAVNVGHDDTSTAATPPHSPHSPISVRDSKLTTFVRESKFLTTSRMLRLFAQGCADPPPGARVVYVDGGWDMFHAGHVDFLRRASELGDFVLVGVHNDVIVNRHRGSNYPIMNTNERTLSVLSCQYVGDVVIDPPWHLTREMIAALNISVVAHGSTHDPNDDGSNDPYAVPKAMGIYKALPSAVDLTVETIVSRIQANHDKVRAKIERKKQSEQEYYEHRYGFKGATEQPQ